MKIIFICTNYGSYKDGIGHYTKNIADELSKSNGVNVENISGLTCKLNKRQMITSRIMINKIDDFLKLGINNIDKDTSFIIEYPFLEWNPLIIIKLKKLRKICKKKDANIILSIHEYKRVSVFRRRFIDLLIKLSDGLMVTDSGTYNMLKKFKKQMLIRPIPSNIINKSNSKKNEKYFCFFGLINKSKSFNEMINAWKLFNYNNEYTLNIYSSSDVNLTNSEENNIFVFKGLDDLNLSNKLAECKYAILPIKPYIGMNNASLKATAQYDCLPIGIFESDYLANMGISIKDSEYSTKNILNALNKSIEIDKEEYLIKLNNLKSFSKKFSFENNSNLIKEFILNLK